MNADEEFDFDDEWDAGRQALHRSCGRGDLYTATRLLPGADPNGEWDVGDRGPPRLPLHEAVSTDRLDLVRLLLRAGAVVNRAPDILVSANSSERIDLLVDGGADLEGTGTRNRTALLAAVELAKVDVVRALLRRGASRAAKNSDGRTPLEVAEACEYKERGLILELLRGA